MTKLKLIILALALSGTSFQTAAQAPKPEPAPKAIISSPGGVAGGAGGRVEFRLDEDHNDENRSFGFAHSIVGDVEKNVRRVFAGPGEPDQPLVISTGALDNSAIQNLEEDLTIMARILEKSINRASGAENANDRKAMGIHLWALGQGNRGARDLYIEGTGAIFIVNAGIPLSGPPKAVASEERKEPANSAWESARNEVFGESDEDPRRVRKDRPSPAFDPARLEALKKNLIESFKNASNIRGLKDNETVTVVVQEPAGRVMAAGNSWGPQKAPPGKGDVFAFASDGRKSSRALLTLRAKKSDIDSFSKGKLDADEFRKKVNVSSYQTGGDSGRSKQ